MYKQRSSYFITELAGYNAARGDFDSEYDNTAELGLNGIEVTEKMFQYVQDYSHGKHLFKDYIDENDEEKKLVAALSVTMLDVYNNKLKARNRRKRYAMVTLQPIMGGGLTSDYQAFKSLANCNWI